MTVACHVFPAFIWQLGAKAVSLTGDTLMVGLIASGTYSYTGGAAGTKPVHVADFLAGDGTNGALTEVSTTGTGYARQALTSVAVSPATDAYTTGTTYTLTCASPSWANSTISAKYAFFYDNSFGGGGDTLNLIMCYWDFGGTNSSSSGSFTLTISGSGLLQWAVS
jgi:hypothetical protein